MKWKRCRFGIPSYLLSKINLFRKDEECLTFVSFLELSVFDSFLFSFYFREGLKIDGAMFCEKEGIAVVWVGFGICKGCDVICGTSVVGFLFWSLKVGSLNSIGWNSRNKMVQVILSKNISSMFHLNSFPMLFLVDAIVNFDYK